MNLRDARDSMIEINYLRDTLNCTSLHAQFSSESKPEVYGYDYFCNECLHEHIYIAFKEVRN